MVMKVNGNESKSNKTINANSGAHTLTHDQIKKTNHSIRITEQLF